jgi:acyl-CoA thioesterase-1
MSRKSRIVIIAAAAVVALGLAGCTAASLQAQRVSTSAKVTATKTAAPVPTSSSTAQTLAESEVPTTAPVVVTIGDSIMKGLGVDPSQAWPALLAKDKGWTVTNLACNGAGFLQIGNSDDCDGDYSKLVPEAVALNPSIVIIQGSSNDLGIGNAALTTQTNAVVSALHSELPFATIVGISPVWGDTTTPSQMNDIDAQVQNAIAQVDGTYLEIGQPLAGQRDLLQGDDVHPTAEGQQLLAQTIEAAAQNSKIAIL